MYSLIQADVDAYLATKRDDEIVGITCHARKCLLTRALLHKYPQHRIGVHSFCAFIDDETVPLSDEMAVIYGWFDSLNRGEIERTITKREWLAEVARRTSEVAHAM